MTPQKFEQVCQDCKMRVYPKKFTKHANIMIAEKLTRENGKPEWEMLWGLERDVPDVAHVLKIDAWRTTPEGFTYMTTEKERLDAVLMNADQFIADSLDVGRYA